MQNAFDTENDVFVIAEIGGNHQGDFNYAVRLTEMAVNSGADAVKYQIYTGDTLVNPRYDIERNKHFKRFELLPAQYETLAKICEDHGVKFMASVWDANSLDYIDKFISIYKIGSGDLTAYDLLAKTIALGKPMILSTGLSNMEEIDDVIRFVNLQDPSYIDEQKLCLLQCTSMYPIPNNEANLNVMLSLKNRFGIPVGYSDHTIGTKAVELAVAMGAKVIEVHFTDDPENKTFRDHAVSLTQAEVRKLRAYIKNVREFQGQFEKYATSTEIESGHLQSFRRGLYAKHTLPKGHVISAEDLISLRPSVGIPANKFFDIVGKKLKIDKDQLEKFSETDFED